MQPKIKISSLQREFKLSEGMDHHGTGDDAAAVFEWGGSGVGGVLLVGVASRLWRRGIGRCLLLGRRDAV
jgi:hypothetical protein